MDLVQGACKSLKLATEEDFISNMPEYVITNIMDRLPIQDAVRTSILSTNWKVKWTLLSQLVFYEKSFKNLVGGEGNVNYKLSNVIGFLLHFKGAIKKFVVHLPRSIIIDVEDINHWFLFLSGKGIKEVTLKNCRETPLMLPTHLFCCLELKDLKLEKCFFNPPPSFRGFPNLTTLHLNMVIFERYKCCQLFTQCSLLENLRISYCTLPDNVKPVEIATLKNLSVLILALNNIDITPVTSSSFFQFVGFFPKLQTFYLDIRFCKFLVETGARKIVPASFPHLKTILLSSIEFGNDVMVSILFEMICYSPNLQTLKILASVNPDVPPTALTSSTLGCNTMRQLQLRSVVFKGFTGSENEVFFVKSLLACSPLLKKIVIELHSSLPVGGDTEKFKLAKKLLKLHRASPIAEIDLI